MLVDRSARLIPTAVSHGYNIDGARYQGGADVIKRNGARKDGPRLGHEGERVGYVDGCGWIAGWVDGWMDG